jgi:GH25 family lysozyme M1 (1,4-beta-N-acetylmuramidase)
MTIYGWDMSHYDAVSSVTAEKTVSEGFKFVTHKAGGDASDAELGAFWAEFKSHRDKLLLGAYWVLYPGNPTGRADAFLARLDNQCPGWRDAPFILQADCEIWNGDPGTKPDKADIKAFCNRLKAKAPKLVPIVYASEGQYNNSLTGLGYPLWNARYRLGNKTGTASNLYALSGGDLGLGWGLYSGQRPAIWQFTSSATIAGQTTCDANAFRGSLTDLTNLLAPGFKPKPPTPEEDPLAGITPQQIADAILDSKIGSTNYPNRTVRQVLNDIGDARDAAADKLIAGTPKANVAAGTPLANLLDAFATPQAPETPTT